jgi:hypothetical protein
MGIIRGTALIGCLAGLTLAPRQASAQAAPPPPGASAPAPGGDFDTWLLAQHDERGRACAQSAIQVVRDEYAIACGEAGLWIVRRDPTRGLVLARLDDLGGKVVGLFFGGGRLWAELERTEARPVRLSSDTSSSRAFPLEPSETPPPSLPPSPPRSPAATPPAPVRNLTTSDRLRSLEGHVVEVRPGEVVIDLGRDDGVKDEQSVELSAVTSEELGNEQAVRREILAVGLVSAASDRFSRVRLGIGERVPKGALARIVNREPSRTRVAPPRLGGFWELAFLARPFLAVSQFGGGFLLDATVGYRFESPFHLEAGFQPFAYGTAKGKPALTPVAAFLKGSYDLPMFEVGLGVGAESIYDTTIGTEPGSGTLLLQQARIGALDGLYLAGTSHVVLFHSSFEFAGFVGSMQIPVGESSWVVMRGGGGIAGYGYGEMGVRALLKGNGDKGSLFFTGTLGGVGVFKTWDTVCNQPGFSVPCTQSVTYAGPMAGAGAEWRL